jgi:hypothetical protein
MYRARVSIDMVDEILEQEIDGRRITVASRYRL